MANNEKTKQPIIEKRFLVRREEDKYKCDAHALCIKKIDDNSNAIEANRKEICWMRKLMMGTLVTGIFTLLSSFIAMVILILQHYLKGNA